MRLIDGDALIEKLKSAGALPDFAEFLIKRAPTIEPKRGKWVEDGGARGYICAACSKDIHTYKTAYCPDCGADMSGADMGREGEG